MIQPLSEHEILLFLLQFVLLLGVAKFLGEIAKRLDQPAVLGELLAGIILGPSILGFFSPALFQWLFPASGTSAHLLEILSYLGLVMLILTVGFETDVKLLKTLGRPVLLASTFGMLVPFLAGLLFGWRIPEIYLVASHPRWVFAIFLGITLSVTAIPVIAKILLDLDVLRRNIGMIIMGSGVIQDLLGYTIFSFFLVAATQTQQISQLAIHFILAMLLIFFLATVGYRFIFRMVKWVDDHALTEGALISLAIFWALLLGAITHKLGLHALLGALMAGMILAAAPRMRPIALGQITKVTDSVFSPIFFAYVGLRVDFLALKHWHLITEIIVIAVLSKIIGSLLGGKIAKLKFWESMALGIGTTARGGMGMILGLLAFSFGLISNEIFALVILMSAVTSLIAPPLLKLVLPKIAITEEEKLRLKAEKDHEKVIFKKKHLRILIPTAGGPNAKKAIELAIPLGHYEDTSITTLFIQRKRKRFSLPFFHPKQLDSSTAAHHELAKQLGQSFKVKVEAKSLVTDGDFSDAVISEIEKGYDLVFLGASGYRNILQSQPLGKIVAQSSAHLVVVKSKENKSRYRRLLVPTRGGYHSKLATEFALLYAEALQAEVTLFHVVKSGKGLLPETVSFDVQSYLNKPERVLIQSRVVEGESPAEEILKELYHNDYDLLILGSENRSVSPDLNLGYSAEVLIEDAPCSVVTLIPRGKKPKG